MKNIIIILLLSLSLKSKAQMNLDSSMNNFIYKWIGKPYKFGGTSESGIDCSALVQKFYKVILGFEIPRTCIHQFRNSIKISFDEIKIGDIIFFKSKLSPSKWHCGIYIGDNKFIHSANRKEGVKINNIADKNYSNSIIGIGRFN